MYDELIEELRRHHCDAKEDDTQEVCEECAYDVIIADKSVPSGIASVCVCGLMNRAADAIEQLSNAGSAYGRGWTLGYDAGREESKPRWIPVTEQLPEDLQNVLVIDDGRVTIGHCEHFYGDEQIYVDWHDTLYYPINPPCWMPLPEPPKEE